MTKDNSKQKEAEAKKKAARAAVIAKGKAIIAELKEADNLARENLQIQLDDHRTKTQEGIDQFKVQFEQELINAPKGTKSSLRKNQSAQLKAYREERKQELRNLKTQGKADILAIKQKASEEIKRLNTDMYQVKDGNPPGTQTGIAGFYTDKDGKKHPLTPPKGK